MSGKIISYRNPQYSENIETLRSMLKEIDTNDNGVITLEEFEKSQMGHLSSF